MKSCTAPSAFRNFLGYKSSVDTGISHTANLEYLDMGRLPLLQVVLAVLTSVLELADRVKS